ncbi:MAG: F0F1 ATP synthase subunit delta [Gemmatimonadaceae bacterium]
MREATIARNYAEALLTLATKAENRDGFGGLIRDVANAITNDVTVRRFLESPRVSYEEKNEILSKAFGDRMPRMFLRFLQSVVHNRRQMLIPVIATEYSNLLDAAEGRVHADVTVAMPVDDAEVQNIAAQLSRALGKSVVPHVTVDKGIMGGVVIRIGDTVMDGSVRRRLNKLATRMRVPA